jgi:hypothetical protein
MKPKLALALGTFLVLGVLAFVTLDGTIRIATLVFLAGFALKTYLVDLRNRRD